MANEIDSKSAKSDSTTVFVTLAIIAVIAVVGISTLVPGFKIIGFAPLNPIGTAIINLTSSLDITLTDTNITIGNGSVSAGSPFAWVQSTGGNIANGGVTNGSWTVTSDGLMLENTGNVVANVSITATSSSFIWIGGTNPNSWFNYTNSETNACLLASGAGGVNSWIGINATGQVVNMCQKFNVTDTNDAIRIDFRLQIPSDSPSGDKVNQFTFSATQST